MLKAKINVNGMEWDLTGDKEDIVYALRNATSTSIPTEKQITDKVDTFVNHELLNTPSKLMGQITQSITTGAAKFSKDNLVKMYQWLAGHGNYTIKQFQITRGGKTNPTQYTVCLVWDESKQRYCWYNPKTEDTFLQSFSINDVIEKLKKAESGFSLLHTVANRISDKMNVVNGLMKIGTNPFPEVEFNNYEKHSIYNDSINWINKYKRFTSRQLNSFLRGKSYTNDNELSKNISVLQKNKVIRHIPVNELKTSDDSKATQFSKFYERI